MKLFGTFDCRARIDYLEFKVSKLMKFDFLSKRYFKQNSLRKRVEIEKITNDII